ncbi:MAG: hypothetical protein ACKESB_03575 [Candidatus Hodgkinia cicadicola]
MSCKAMQVSAADGGEHAGIEIMRRPAAPAKQVVANAAADAVVGKVLEADCGQYGDYEHETFSVRS